VTPKNLYFGGFWAQKTISSYSFDRIVLIFGYIVERSNAKILSTHFFAISILNADYDVISDVISGFARSSRRAMRFSPLDSSDDFMGEVVSVFLYLLYFSSYDFINDVIRIDADCTPGREPRSVAANVLLYIMHQLL